MKFVKWEDLKSGMRLARPIYSKSGVLLYERDAKLSTASIESVKNFGLLGIYILEPAEPLPPMSEEDLAFEKFEIKTVSSLQEEIGREEQQIRDYEAALDHLSNALQKNFTDGT